jgi:hypothetical protein
MSDSDHPINGCADCIHFHSFRHDCDKRDEFLELEDMDEVGRIGCPDKKTRKQHMIEVRKLQKEMEDRTHQMEQKMANVVRCSLNPHTVTMVAPKHCLKGYYRDLFGEREYPFDRYCGHCEYHNGQSECRYEVYVTEAATGNFETDEDELHYIQWGCAGCGELIKIEDSISYIYNNLRTDTHECPKCKTPHRCIDYGKDDKLTFAVPVKEEV